MRNKFNNVLAWVLAVVLTVGLAPPLSALAASQPNTVIFTQNSRTYTSDGTAHTNGLNTAPFDNGNGYTYMDIAELRSVLGITWEVSFTPPSNTSIIVKSNGTICVPIAEFGHAAGYEVSYNGSNRQVTFRKNGQPQTVTTTANRTPTRNNPVEMHQSPQTNTNWGVQGRRWMVINAWNPNVNGGAEYKHLVKMSNSNDVYWLGNGYGGSVWFFQNEAEARAAYNNNSNAPGPNQPGSSGSTTISSPDRTPTTGNPTRIDHPHDNSEWIVKSPTYYAVANYYNPDWGGQEYKILIAPSQDGYNFGANVGGAVWFFRTEKEARDQFAANGLPTK